MARRSDEQVAEEIVEDIVQNGPGSAAEIAASVGISPSRFYALMVMKVNEAAERLQPGHRVMPPKQGQPYALLRKYRNCDPATVLQRGRQAQSKNHRLAMELDVEGAGPEQKRLVREAQAHAIQGDLLIDRIKDWVEDARQNGQPG